MALPGVPATRPGFDEAAALLLASRRPTTWAGQGSKLAKYLHYCEHVVSPPLRPVPASQQQILTYLGWLFSTETVAAGSLQGYLSAISSLHADFGFPSPTVGKLMIDAKHGYAELEGERQDAEGRAPIPCDVIMAIVRWGLHASDLEDVRAAACTALNACFFCRADTGVHLLVKDLVLDADAVSVREQHLKNAPRGRHVLLRRPCDSQDPVWQLLTRFQGLVGSRDPAAYFWRLPHERRANWRPALVDSWLQRCLTAVGAVPPPGVLWSSHALRSGGATGAHSIGVQDHVIARWGVWASLRSLHRYIDALVPPSQAAWILFNHLLRPGVEDLRALYAGEQRRQTVA